MRDANAAVLRGAAAWVTMLGSRGVLASLWKRDASIIDVFWGLSGVTLLEKKLEQTKPAYREYVERTSAFFPWWPADRAKPDPGR